MPVLLHLLIVATTNAACSQSPLQEILPGIVDTARGVGPWLVGDGSNGRWAWAQNTPAKTLWILRTTHDRIVIRGRELGTGAVVRFQTGGPASPISDSMIVDDPWSASVKPGGATWEIRNQYLFFPSQVYYPSPGCFEFDVAAGPRHATITLEIK
jgi:hypothetical protein